MQINAYEKGTKNKHWREWVSVEEYRYALQYNNHDIQSTKIDQYGWPTLSANENLSISTGDLCFGISRA